MSEFKVGDIVVGCRPIDAYVVAYLKAAGEEKHKDLGPGLNTFIGRVTHITEEEITIHTNSIFGEVVQSVDAYLKLANESQHKFLEKGLIA